jgi:FlaA1/EpsC-like NDP-sugar epimerase
VLLFTGVALAVKLPILYRMNLYNRYWRTAGISDLTVLVAAVGVSTVVLVLLVMMARAVSPAPGRPIVISLSVLLIDALLTATVMTGSRFGVHGLYDWHDQRQARIGGRRTLVVGAGDAGVIAVREMRSYPRLDMEPVAFADEDPLKINTLIEGVSVAGSCSDIPALVESHQIQRIIVAMPEASVHQQRKVIGLCRQTGVVTQALPGTYEILAGFKTISCLPQIDINHLLHRQPVSTDLVEVADHLRGATVLVTGAGGSIGSELCRQIARLGPVQIVLLGHGENSIAELALDLSLSFPDLFAPPVIADIRDRQRIAQVIDGFHPDVIFHAAAHKHVPLMETGVAEAVTNNLLGTRCVLQAAEQYGVKRLVLISTDKAVHPSNVMGATKRLCELLVVAAAQRSGHAYMAVRFGNVLGSRGSVIPIFQRQVAAGGPLTITHPDMRRYFMTIPEAVQLVLQAGVLGQGGEVFVLDMGEPVRILDLATDLVRLSGLEPERDIKIVFTGLRPGEKLDEELFLQTEQVGATKHQKIFVGTCDSSVRADVLDEMVASLIAMAQDETACHDDKRLRHQLLEACRWVDAHQSHPQVFGPKPASVDGSVPAVSIPAAHTRLPEPA